MGYLKIQAQGRVIELTPDVIRQIVPDIKAQVSKLTMSELMETVNALGIPLGSLIRILKGGDDGGT